MLNSIGKFLRWFALLCVDHLMLLALLWLSKIDGEGWGLGLAKSGEVHLQIETWEGIEFGEKVTRVWRSFPHTMIPFLYMYIHSNSP